MDGHDEDNSAVVDRSKINGCTCNCAATEVPPQVHALDIHVQQSTLVADDASSSCEEARDRKQESEQEGDKRLSRLYGGVRTMLECVGEDPHREGLMDTPTRYAKAFLFFTRGYEEDLDKVVSNAIFHEDYKGLVIAKDLEFSSLCEHHLVPFTGKMHIGYIPNGQVIGSSKLARIAEMFSRRLQLQERLTRQVATALFELLNPHSVAVVLEASHLCMAMRGVQKADATTTTSFMLGTMRSEAETRDGFIKLIT